MFADTVEPTAIEVSAGTFLMFGSLRRFSFKTYRCSAVRFIVGVGCPLWAYARAPQTMFADAMARITTTESKSRFGHVREVPNADPPCNGASSFTLGSPSQCPCADRLHSWLVRARLLH